MLPADGLKAEARRLGFNAVGVCSAEPPVSTGHYMAWLEAGYAGSMDFMHRSVELRSDLETLLPGVRSVVCVGLNYNQPLPNPDGSPKIARYALGRDYHKVMRAKLRRLAAWIESAVPEATSRACVDSAPVLEREYAHRAGLGWYGKNTCLIDSRTGSWFFIGTLLTTADIETDKPSKGGCGTCTACIDACPTGAIVQLDGVWSVDSRRCISYLTIEEKSPVVQGDTAGWTVGCDVCQEVCPFNQPRPSQPDRAPVTTDPDLRAIRQWPPLVELQDITWHAWDELTRGSAVRRVGWEGLKRNARANLNQQPEETE
ncbi:MAG: tRNA epoxyqueuosine(34) reductase QueG [Armatimonadetes bacterium]|nr:tRNA epoxyqueuosine(34) reductase QueG [Armatimonadota bacterium]